MNLKQKIKELEVKLADEINNYLRVEKLNRNILAKMKENFDQHCQEVRQLKETIRSLAYQPFKKVIKGGSQLYSCRKCSKTTSQMTQIIEHLEMCNPESLPYDCDQCHRRFLEERNLKSHKTTIHK